MTSSVPGGAEHWTADHGWHQIEPGVDVDMKAENRSPDPRWCNVCGSGVAPGGAVPPDRAVEVAVEALRLYEANGCCCEWPHTERARRDRERARQMLAAAVPHLRKQIAAEERAKIIAEGVPAALGWANADTGPANLRLYALDQGNAPRWAKPRARVAEDALIERGSGEGDRCVVLRIGNRWANFGATP